MEILYTDQYSMVKFYKGRLSEMMY